MLGDTHGSCNLGKHFINQGITAMRSGEILLNSNNHHKTQPVFVKNKFKKNHSETARGQYQ